MPYIFTSKRRLVQSRAPVWPYAIDESHPLAVDLRGCFVWREGALYDLVRNQFFTKHNTGGTLTDYFDPVTEQWMTEFAGTSTTQDRWSLGTIASDDPLALHDVTFATMVTDIRHDASGGGGFPRMVDKSDGGNAANGWGVWVGLGQGGLGDDVQYCNVDTSTPPPQNGLISNIGGVFDEPWGFVFGETNAGRLEQRFWRDGDIVGTENTVATNTFPTVSTGFSVGHWNHSTTNRQWDGLIRRMFIWGNFLEINEMQEVCTRAGAWEFFEIYGRTLYFFPPASTVADIPTLDVTLSLDAPSTLEDSITNVPPLEFELAPYAPTSMVYGVGVTVVVEVPPLDINLLAYAANFILIEDALEVATIKLVPPGQTMTTQGATGNLPWVAWSVKTSALITAMVASGTTSQRPDELLYVGRVYFDTDLGHPIWYNGSSWVDADGVAA